MAKASDNPRTSKPKGDKSGTVSQIKEIIVTITALVSLLILIFGGAAIESASTEQESIDFVKWAIIILSVSLATFIAYSIAKLYKYPGKLIQKIINPDNVYIIITSISTGLVTAVYLVYNFNENWSTLLKNGLLFGILGGVILGILFADFMRFLFDKVAYPFYDWIASIGWAGKSGFFFVVSIIIAFSIPLLIKIETNFIQTFNDWFNSGGNVSDGNVNATGIPWESYEPIGEFWIIFVMISIICLVFLYLLIRIIHEARDWTAEKAKKEAVARKKIKVAEKKILDKKKETAKKAKAAAKKKAKAKKESAKKAKAEAKIKAKEKKEAAKKAKAAAKIKAKEKKAEAKKK